MADLPHAHPFRFVDTRASGTTPVVAPSAGAFYAGRGGFPLSLAIEAMAQAVLADPSDLREGGGEREGSPPGRAHLAGIEAARILAEIRPGDRLEPRSELAGRFGPALKVRCTLHRGDETVAEATLLLTMTQ